MCVCVFMTITMLSMLISGISPEDCTPGGSLDPCLGHEDAVMQ